MQARQNMEDSKMMLVEKSQRCMDLTLFGPPQTKCYPLPFHFCVCSRVFKCIDACGIFAPFNEYEGQSFPVSLAPLGNQLLKRDHVPTRRKCISMLR